MQSLIVINITFPHRTTFAAPHEFFIYCVPSRFTSRYFLISLLIFSLANGSFKSACVNIWVFMDFPVTDFH